MVATFGFFDARAGYQPVVSLRNAGNAVSRKSPHMKKAGEVSGEKALQLSRVD
jgi:hypothetical protein